MSETKKTRKPKSSSSMFNIDYVPRGDMPARIYTEYDKILDEYIKKEGDEEILRIVMDSERLQSARLAFKKRIDALNKREDRKFDLRIAASKESSAIYISKEEKGSVKLRTRKQAA